MEKYSTDNSTKKCNSDTLICHYIQGFVSVQPDKVINNPMNGLTLKKIIMLTSQVPRPSYYNARLIDIYAEIFFFFWGVIKTELQNDQ